jgi:hypothetical protein
MIKDDDRLGGEAVDGALEPIVSPHLPNWGWRTTSPNPNRPAFGVDAGQRGWKLHLVDLAQPGANWYGKNKGFSLCGMRPRHGWGLDLFIDAPCERCAKAEARLGIDVPLP